MCQKHTEKTGAALAVPQGVLESMGFNLLPNCSDWSKLCNYSKVVRAANESVSKILKRSNVGVVPEASLKERSFFQIRSPVDNQGDGCVGLPQFVVKDEPLAVPCGIEAPEMV